MPVEGVPNPLPILANIDAMPAWLRRARNACNEVPPELAKAAEWLLDNDYHVHRAIRQIEQDMPDSFYRKLIPITSSDDRTPRIFALAHDLLRVSRLQLSLATVVDYCLSYQHRTVLTIAELWALPTMLRLGCLEILVTAFGTLFPAVQPPFEGSRFACGWEGFDESERVARAIANLGLIASIPWDEFFERTSVVEAALATDPAGVYSRMDFATRDSYRRVVEEIAFGSESPESAVAEKAIALAAAAGNEGPPSHVGHWLIGVGRSQLEQALSFTPPATERLRRRLIGQAARLYPLTLMMAGFAALLLPGLYLWTSDAGLLARFVCLAAAIIPSSILANSLVQWLVTMLVPPRILPKLDFSVAIANDCPTLVAVPVLVGSVREAQALVEQIERHRLSNPDPSLRFALLSDLHDAASENLPGDEAIVEALRDGIRGLNLRFGSSGSGPFHLLHRARQHNPHEGCWMGWERKRGKLEQLNRLLLGEQDGFAVREGASLDGIRFVVTVDADTRLPQGSVNRLVGALAHPLNRAHRDPRTGRIFAGYSVIQPRVEISPESGNRSLFSRLFTGDTAIDIYSRAVSDVYQDLFGEGIFVGKGIYEVASFHGSVDGRVPENAILSHDLFEGILGRAGLATDVVLYEKFPGTYLEHLRRWHRWVRGDWQLLPWLMPHVPARGGRARNPLGVIDRLKIFDNLRRSLVAPGLLGFAATGWLLLPGIPWLWTVLTALAPAGNIFTDLVTGLARGRRRGAIHGLAAQLGDQAGRIFLVLVFLPIEAAMALNAIGVALWRMAVSRRHLLEWTSAAQTAVRLETAQGRIDLWRHLWRGPAVAAGLAGALVLLNPTALAAASPLILLWLAAPEIGFRIGRPRRVDPEPLVAADRRFLREIARRTWLFFETFAGPEDNWLPPDNYQEEPHEEIAHRTSPTNIGMMLLAGLTARDLGHIGGADLAARTSALFETLDRLELYRGHFLNWYDTRSLAPLEPRYVSTVDSGNLALCLLATAAGCDEAADERIVAPQRWDGLADTATILADTLARLVQHRAAAFDSLTTAIDLVLSARDLASLSVMLDETLPKVEADLVRASEAGAPIGEMREAAAWVGRLRQQGLTLHRELAGRDPALAPMLRRLAEQAREMAYRMDFRPLYDSERQLFHIGYNASANRLDPHHYDLLATEARLASYFAIAKGDVPVKHWFFLGRPLTRQQGGLTLLSWNGSMFEYLMAPVFLRSGPDTLLAESERTAVAMQRRYGERMGIPWGISESAYAERDPHHRYRYQAFGVPGLGLRRGLEKDVVVAPYASALALGVEPARAAANLRKLWSIGGGGLYGLFEALDFTPDRVPPEQSFIPIRAYMAHHQGMLLSAIGNALCDNRLPELVARDGRIRVADLLLSERIPRELPSEIERVAPRELPSRTAPAIRPPYAWPAPAAKACPQVHMLGNGRMACWISEAGGGALRWRHHAVTRFVADATRDADGLWIYARDEESKALWSVARQPTQAIPQDYSVTFHPHMAEFHRRDHGISMRTEVAVTRSDDVELRRITLVNETARPRTITLTSYGEVVLAPPLDDERHPAFSKLFVGCEYRPELGALLFRRRARRPGELLPVVLHRMIGGDGVLKPAGYEADRRAFLGRGGSIRDPAGLTRGLSSTTGFTLDPIMALQASVSLKPHEIRQLCFLTIASSSAEAAIETADRYASLAAIDWALEDSSAAAAHEVQRLRLEPDRLPVLQKLASLLLHSHGSLRAAADQLRQNRGGQPLLWGLGISGDLPILLVRTGADEDVAKDFLRDLILAHRLWLNRGFVTDLVILKSAASGYLEPARERLLELLREHDADGYVGRRGGIHLVAADQIGADVLMVMKAAAGGILDANDGSLARQLATLAETHRDIPHFEGVAPMPLAEEEEPPLPGPEPLRFDNGLGGFTEDGREYVIQLAKGRATPAPWANVLANPGFGTIVTEAGGGFTWAENSGENRLTPWSNDPVADTPSEMLYLRDEETAKVWTPSPFAAAGDCQIRHAAGVTQWLQRSQGLDQTMLAFVPVDDPVKLVRLRLRNLRDRPRRITATYYAEWLLGSVRSTAKPRVVADYDSAARAIFARNPWNPDFAGRCAFLTCSLEAHSLTGDRAEFLGRESDMREPEGLRRWGLSNIVAAGADSCAAWQVHLDLGPGEDAEVLFALGQGADRADAERLARHWQDGAQAERALGRLHAHWDELLDAVKIATPDPAFDQVVNRWLLYQTISSRILARAGFYQAGGAIGFRDQLQDMLALLHVDPARVRAHILACCAHQFEEGDVLHWWHPPSDRGVRTRCSDDLLWLPFVAARYVQATGDRSILQETTPFLRAPPLASDEEDRYAAFESSAAPGASVFEHCARALDRGLTRGGHGLPLIGGGDWNDGMDRLGRAGRGESVWLAWFAIVTAEAFASLAEGSEQGERAGGWLQAASSLREAAEAAGWDGAWYRRAYDDEGEPIGSAGSDECRIDSIAQSWAAFAGADPLRVDQALQSARRELVDEASGIVRLLAPPFQHGSLEPGYIKAYPPGVRENGGQYTHAAAWLGLALTATGDGDGAQRLFTLLNPLSHSSGPAAAERYRLEPYVLAADIIAEGPFVGQGGWSWYTGSSAWLWRLAIEGILGLGWDRGRLTLKPCLPRNWGGFEAEIRLPGGRIELKLEDPQHLGSGRIRLQVDGRAVPEAAIARPEGGATIRVIATICPPGVA
jgi:cyclic beta-1,2-glucan synthetase